ncbi:7391_t:CDS:2 [Funneliformis caledonium]|uniref:7391_t:CDS:1 n=1 Tax=Funneliformis caledonium TaxID=1117310 RepID=A0A9N8ZNN8_9GLOM|nr:7391_t:CDS:2 [Funneliformis caledonium]
MILYDVFVQRILGLLPNENIIKLPYHRYDKSTPRCQTRPLLFDSTPTDDTLSSNVIQKVRNTNTHNVLEFWSVYTLGHRAYSFKKKFVRQYDAINRLHNLLAEGRNTFYLPSLSNINGKKMKSSI